VGANPPGRFYVEPRRARAEGTINNDNGPGDDKSLGPFAF
jgi:hypothetical protein